MLKPVIAAAALAVVLATPAQADNHAMKTGTIKMESAHDAATTLDRLEKIFASKGITVFTRVDHAAGAQKAGMELPPTQLLLFGNLKLGTPLMKANREVGIALPMKALAWTDADGKTWLAVTDPASLKDQFGLEGVDEVVAKMTGAVTNMGKAATAKE